MTVQECLDYEKEIRLQKVIAEIQKDTPDNPTPEYYTARKLKGLNEVKSNRKSDLLNKVKCITGSLIALFIICPLLNSFFI